MFLSKLQINTKIMREYTGTNDTEFLELFTRAEAGDVANLLRFKMLLNIS